MSATRRAKAVAMGVLGVAGWVAMAFVNSAAGAAAERSCLLPDADFAQEELAVADRGADALAPYVAERIASVGCAWPSDVRAIVIDRREVRLQAGGRVSRRFELDGPEPDVMTLDRLVDVIDDPEWISKQEGGIVTVAAAIVQRPGTQMVVGGPAVKEVRLLDRRYVGIVGAGASASFTDVTVVSWSADGDGPARGHNRLRPFVLYRDGSQFDVSNAVFAWLGSRAAGATGVTWADRSGGTVVSTAFSNNYVGATATEASESLIFMRSVFRDSVTDGMHAASGNGPTLETNTMQGNGGDGVVVEGAAGAVLRDNHVWGNDRHGVVVKGGVTGVEVVDNVIEPNGVDGVVLEGVVGGRVVGNIIGAHRSGIRLAGRDTIGNTLSRNVISNSPIGVQLAGPVTDNRIEGNAISRAAVARIHTEETVASAASGGEIGSALGGPLGTGPRQDRNGLWLVGAVLAICGVGGESVRRLHARAVPKNVSIDLDHFDRSAGKAGYARTIDH